MKRYLIPLLLFPIAALGQAIDPFQAFINEYSAANVAHEHAVASASGAIRAYQTLLQKNVEDEARMQTLIEWLKAAQSKEAK
jgi:hypothetical protein